MISENTKTLKQSVKDFVSNPCTHNLTMYSLTLEGICMSPAIEAKSLRWYEILNRIQDHLYKGVCYDIWSKKCLYADYARAEKVWYIGTSNKSLSDPYRPYCLSYNALKNIEEEITFVVIFRQVSTTCDCRYTYQEVNFNELDVFHTVSGLLKCAVQNVTSSRGTQHDAIVSPVERSALTKKYVLSTPGASYAHTSRGEISVRGESSVHVPHRASSVHAKRGASSVQTSQSTIMKRPRFVYTDEQNDWLYDKLYEKDAGREGWEKVRKQFLWIYPEVDISVKQLKEKLKNMQKNLNKGSGLKF